jgi:hypothetical protein
VQVLCKEGEIFSRNKNLSCWQLTKRIMRNKQRLFRMKSSRLNLILHFGRGRCQFNFVVKMLQTLKLDSSRRISNFKRRCCKFIYLGGFVKSAEGNFLLYLLCKLLPYPLQYTQFIFSARDWSEKNVHISIWMQRESLNYYENFPFHRNGKFLFELALRKSQLSFFIIKVQAVMLW